MVVGEKANGSQSSIDAILRSLTNRPNVESTLILSRKDGSIIKAEGFSSAEKRRRAQSTVAYNEDVVTRTTADDQDGDRTAAEAQLHPIASPAEELARSVFQFVKSAVSLGTTLCTAAAEIEQGGDSLRPSQHADKSVTETNKIAVDESEDLREEAQVQLMRLRIKSREIIVFPDPQYLCCVVQKVGKQGGAAETR